MLSVPSPSLAPLPSPVFQMMRSHLADAARELFSDFDIVVHPAPDRGNVPLSSDEQLGVAVIGYAGRGVRGALVLSVGEGAVRAWMAAAGVPDGDLADTLGEFSNMLLGRLKARLLPLGISILATTPTAVLGSGLSLSDPPCNFTWESLDGPDWRLRLRLEADFDTEFKLLERPRDGVGAQSGDVIEFELTAEKDEA